MQDIDSIADVKPLSRPVRLRPPRVNMNPLRNVARSQRLGRITRHRSRRRHCGQEPAIRTPEAKLSVGVSLHLVALFVHRAVMPTTEQCEIRQRRWSSACPVTNVVTLTER